MRKRKVLFIFDRVLHYQVDLFVELEKALADQDVELHLLSGEIPKGDSGRVAVANAIITNERKFKFTEVRVQTYTLRVQSGVIRHIRDIQPDLVVIQSAVGSVTNWLILLLKKFLGYKAVSWQCGYEYNPSRFKDLLLSLFIPMFDFHLAYHSNAQKYCLKYGADDSRIRIIHNTINDSAIKSMDRAKAKAVLCEEFPVLAGKQIVLYVGAVLEEKRIELVLDALDEINSKNILMLVVGDGPHLSVLRSLCTDRSDVIFTGRVIQDVGKYFDAADIFVLPGTGGLAINEAMFHGLPILAGYADGSADDLVQNGENGYRLMNDTSSELAKLLRMITNDVDKMTRFGQRSRSMYMEKFTFEKFVGRVSDALLKL